MRLIQIPVANRPECVAALDTAFSIAKRTGANVRGVHIRAHRDTPTDIPLGQGFRHAWNETVNWRDSNEKESASRSQAAEVLFREIAEANGYKLARRPSRDLTPIAIWQERVGTPDHIMPIIGPTADMMIVSRPASRRSHKSSFFMMQALMNSHRPVLVVPHQFKNIDTRSIAVAWNNSGEAARAVHANLPLLKIADEVTFLTVSPVASAGPSASEMIQFLRHHGVSANKVSVRKGNAEVEISKCFKTIGANLLIMGAYSRNRVSELFFGGVTNHMLFHSELPVLTLHSQ